MVKVDCGGDWRFLHTAGAALRKMTCPAVTIPSTNLESRGKSELNYDYCLGIFSHSNSIVNHIRCETADVHISSKT